MRLATLQLPPLCTPTPVTCTNAALAYCPFSVKRINWARDAVVEADHVMFLQWSSAAPTQCRPPPQILNKNYRKCQKNVQIRSQSSGQFVQGGIKEGLHVLQIEKKCHNNLTVIVTLLFFFPVHRRGCRFCAIYIPVMFKLIQRHFQTPFGMLLWSH